MSANVEAEMRAKVLRAWGAQSHPLVLAPRFDLAKYWLVQNDDFLASWQGSYERMIVTPTSPHRLRGWRGTLVIVIPDRIHRSAKEWDAWSQTLATVGTLHGVSTWTEALL